VNILSIIWLVTIFISVVSQIILFALQADALRRYKHRSFRLLAAGSICFFIYAAIGAIPYLFTVSTSVLTGLLITSVVFAVVGVAFGLWGTTLLFRRFGELQRAASGVVAEAA